LTSEIDPVPPDKAVSVKAVRGVAPAPEVVASAAASEKGPVNQAAIKSAAVVVTAPRAYSKVTSISVPLTST